MQSLEDVVTFIKKTNGVLLKQPQVCHIRNLAAALSYSEDNTTGSQLLMIFFIGYVSHACFKILLHVPQIVNMVFM